MTGHGDDEEDGSFATLGEGRGKGVGGVDRSGEVDFENPGPIRRRDVPKWEPKLPRTDTDGIDQVIDGAQLRREGLDVVQTGHVALSEQDGPCQWFGIRLPVEQAQATALGGKGFGDGPADPA